VTQSPKSTEEVAIHRWVAAATEVPQDRIRWADDSPPWPKLADGPWVSLRWLGGPPERAWIEYHRRTFDAADVAVSAVDVGASRLTAAGHPYQTGDGPVVLDGAAPPGNTTAGVDVWVIRVSSSLLHLAATFADAINGVPITLSSAGTLPLTIKSTTRTMRAGEELSQVTRKVGAHELAIQCRGLDAFGILKRASVRGEAPRLRALLNIANVGLLSVGNVQNVGAAINAATYEPRASMTVRLSIEQSHVDTETIGESFQVEATVS
jgi:hypothetical protein